MTLTTLITLNAILAATVVYGLVWLLGHGIRSDRQARAERSSRLHALPSRRSEHDRLAA